MSELTETQKADLAALSACIVPASERYRVPGADDPAIQADMLATMGRDAVLIQQALAQLAALAGGPFAAVPAERRQAVAQQLRAAGGPAVAALTRVVLQTYYRDDRVVRSLGREPRAPFPQGHVLEDGDWSLLDPVRARAPMWKRG
ncbi:MAG TPA: hypothetical protein VHB27_10215 [Rhodopila sp.]|uniref:hypothetical protein n=1 Tax=Rhodopila sp. TaxID=2480087 RepID=UPI002C9CB7B8|nr:hypothetical protein [Rhodopila sp.]HVY15596.1 hypothetical protein [Rhodopila sp.]